MGWQPFDKLNPKCGPVQPCPMPSIDGAIFATEPTFQLIETGCQCGAETTPARTCEDGENDMFCAICNTSRYCIDLVLDENDDLDASDPLISEVLVQLAVKGRKRETADDTGNNPCADSNCLDCHDDGGWWWDSFRDATIGSRLGTLEGRSPYRTANNQTRLEAEQIIREDLQFLIDKGYVDSIDIETEIDSCGFLCVKYIDLYPPRGSVLRAEVAVLWRAQTTA